MRSRLRNKLSNLAAVLGIVVVVPALGLMLLNDGGGASGGDGGAGGAGDAAGGGDAGAGSQGGDAGGAGGDAGGAGDDGKGGDAKTLTQAELDALVEQRLARAKKAWEKEVTDAAERAKMDEAERLKAEKADAEKAVEDAKREALAARVEARAESLALKAKVDPDKLERFLKIADLSELDEFTKDGTPDTKAIEAHVAKTLKAWPEFAAKVNGGGASGGEFNGGGGQEKAKSLDEAVTAYYANT